jgi:hypothetical protein
LGLAERCEFAGVDIMQGVPCGGDLYVLKHVLRDWDDEHAGHILRNCRDAMPVGGVLLIVDAILDPRNGKDRVIKLLDLEQMFWLSGRLRTWPEWRVMCERAGLTARSYRSTPLVDGMLIEVRKSPKAST